MVHICQCHLRAVLVLYLQSFVEVLVHFHDGGLVATSVTVVGGTENGHYIHDVGPVVALCKFNKERIVRYIFVRYIFVRYILQQ